MSLYRLFRFHKEPEQGSCEICTSRGYLYETGFGHGKSRKICAACSDSLDRSLKDARRGNDRDLRVARWLVTALLERSKALNGNASYPWKPEARQSRVSTLDARKKLNIMGSNEWLRIQRLANTFCPKGRARVLRKVEPTNQRDRYFRPGFRTADRKARSHGIGATP